ncbi:MAG TPA: SDR family oxidoreductase [Acidimicrobiales bacterium]|nr:SDR family oxidoreductase [Acidimicrobiales bacterium]
MPVRDLSQSTAVVTGASRGFGRAAAVALAERGARVVGVARHATLLAELHDELGDAFVPEVADVTDPALPGRLFSSYRPTTVVLNAGAAPPIGTLAEQSWESFSTNWSVDVQQVFNFSREALLAPLDHGSVVVSLSSGAALRGSPMSGGYAGAKATVRLISSYARSESERSGLGVRFVSLLPPLTSATALGMAGVGAYAGRAGISVEQFLERLGRTPTADEVASVVVDLATDDEHAAPAYALSPAGELQPLDF